MLVAKPDSDVGLPAMNPDKHDLAYRVDLVVGRAGMGRQKFADQLGLKLRTLNDQIKRGVLETDMAVPIARAANVTLDWLILGLGPMQRSEVEVILPPRRPAAGAPEGFVVVPRYEVRASAGSGVINPTDRIVEQMIVSEEYIRRRLRRRPQDMAILEALGDSMSPTIQDGDVMMVDISITELRASAIYLLLVDEELVVKRLHKRPGGSILIISDNTRYPEEEVTPSERLPIRIVGQVLWYGRPIPG